MELPVILRNACGGSKLIHAHMTHIRVICFCFISYSFLSFLLQGHPSHEGVQNESGTDQSAL